MRIALLVLALAACSPAKPACAIPQAATRGPVFLWRVQRAHGPVVWLYGTIHDAGFAAVPAQAVAALDGAKRFASELGDVEPDRQTLVDLARLPFGHVLDQMLPADDWWELVDIMRGSMTEDQLRHAQPWFVMTRLTSKVAPSPRPSMDDALAVRARDHGIPVEALESWQDQMTALTKAVNVADLQQAIHQHAAIACELSRMRAAYDAGDQATLERLLIVRDQATLIDARNARWQAQIEGYAGAEGAFVAVGLGHLLGDTGLPEVLAKAGFAVERVH